MRRIHTFQLQKEMNQKRDRIKKEVLEIGGDPASHIPAHESTAVAAPFRA
tara:strand:+ start:8729 stop:8878 length:150 start_codon:yes stop_codon:yes gene_type:complete